jgi:hypothetical protein
MSISRIVAKRFALPLVTALLLLPAGTLSAQQQSPLSRFLVSGYASANYNVPAEGDARNNFSASFSPIFLFELSPDFLFEAELEFGLEEGGTTTTLEYAQVDYLGFENVLLVAGKFLLPFGVFSERLHPTWINKMPSMPLLYGHAHGGVAEGVLTPILSDVGVMARYAGSLGDVWGLDFSFYVAQGPSQAEHDEDGGDDHAHSIAPASVAAAANGQDITYPYASEIPGIAFGTNFSDNNDNKMLGARLGVVKGPDFEAYVSGFHSMYDDEDYLDLVGANVAAEVRKGGFEFRGEGAMLWQEFEVANEFPTLRSPAYYVQTSRRIGDFEPVVRWSHLLEAKVEDEVARDHRRQFAFGINYWMRPSVPLKLAYEIELDGADRFLVQWAYGF